jgi:hypothetical protein
MKAGSTTVTANATVSRTGHWRVTLRAPRTGRFVVTGTYPGDARHKPSTASRVVTVRAS